MHVITHNLRGTTIELQRQKNGEHCVPRHALAIDGAIVLRDESGVEKIRWNFSEAWPSKWTGPSLSAGTAAVAVETLEITHEELKRA